MHFSKYLGGLTALIILNFISPSYVFGASCPLQVNKPYKASTSPKIYLITKKCTKQHFPNPEIYLSYFSSFRSVKITTTSKLSKIPLDKQTSLSKKGAVATPTQIITPPQTNPQPTKLTQLTESKSEPVLATFATSDLVLTNEGFGATRGPDKPLGDYTPTLYKELTLKASRNETIGFFLKADVNSCEKVIITPPSGVKIEFFDLPFVETTKRSAPSMFLGKQFDPAVPKSNYEICPSNGGWVFADLTVAPGTTSGMYKIPMRLSSGKTMNLNLKVFPMTLSSTEEAMPSYWIFDEWAGAKQHFNGRWDAPDRSELYELYLNSMRDHRMTAVNSEMAPLKIISVNGKKELDVESNGYLKNVIDNRPNNALISIPWNRSLNVENQREYLEAAENTVIRRGWQNRAYIYLTDEPPHSTFSYVAEQAKLAKQIAPHIKVMVTTIADPKLVPFVDIFVVLIDQIHDYNLPSPETYKKLMAEGKIIWLYFSCDSHGCGSSSDTPWPDLMLDNPSVHPRTVGWMNDHYGTSGFLYYYTNLAYYKGNPFSNQFDFGGNGDGNVFYPGRTGEFGLTKEQPVPSLRMKVFRESANDAEYLKMLRNKTVPAVFQSRIESVVKSSTDWSRNFEDYQNLRDDIGEYLATGTLPKISERTDKTWKAISFSIRNTGGLVNRGLDWSIWNNGYIGEKVLIPKKGTYELTVTARGDMAGQDSPHMVVRISGKEVAKRNVDSTAFQDYKFSVELEEGEHQIDIVFTNDYNDPNGKDRNLVINKMRLVSK